MPSVTHHLHPVSGEEPPDDPVRTRRAFDEDGWDDLAGWDDERGWTDEDGFAPLVRPAWWRWVAIAVILAMVVATPLVYALYVLLR